MAMEGHRCEPFTILIVLSSASALLSQANRFRLTNPRRQYEPITCFARTTTGVFLPIRLSDRIFGILSNSSLCDRSERLVLSMGGEAREMWEQIGNDNWGQQPFMNGYFNERYMFYFDAHYGKHFRTFVEFKSGLNSFRIGGPRPIDEKKLDFQDAFLEVGTSE